MLYMYLICFNNQGWKLKSSYIIGSNLYAHAFLYTVDSYADPEGKGETGDPPPLKITKILVRIL